MFSFIRKTKNIEKKFFVDSNIFEENKQPILSNYFLKFFQALGLWENPNIWKHSILYLNQIVKYSSIDLFLSINPKTLRKKRKSKLKSQSSIYILFLQACNYLIKMNIEKMLEIHFSINDIHQHLKVGDFEEITRTLENPHLMGNLNKIMFKHPESKNEKIILILKNALKFIENTPQDSILKLSIINKECHKKLHIKIIKRLLISDNIETKMRIKLWRVIAKDGTLSKLLIHS